MAKRKENNDTSSELTSPDPTLNPEIMEDLINENPTDEEPIAMVDETEVEVEFEDLPPIDEDPSTTERISKKKKGKPGEDWRKARMDKLRSDKADAPKIIQKIARHNQNIHRAGRNGLALGDASQKG